MWKIKMTLCAIERIQSLCSHYKLFNIYDSLYNGSISKTLFISHVEFADGLINGF